MSLKLFIIVKGQSTSTLITWFSKQTGYMKIPDLILTTSVRMPYSVPSEFKTSRRNIMTVMGLRNSHNVYFLKIQNSQLCDSVKTSKYTSFCIIFSIAQEDWQSNPFTLKQAMFRHRSEVICLCKENLGLTLPFFLWISLLSLFLVKIRQGHKMFHILT